jgi:hypothetical protein
MFSMIWLPAVTGVACEMETAPLVGMAMDQMFDVSLNAA